MQASFVLSLIAVFIVFARDGVGDSLSGGRLMSDFDMMLERRRSEQRKRRKKKDIDLINDNDDAIARLIADMRLAAREAALRIWRFT
jgi:hypothetical protein